MSKTTTMDSDLTYYDANKQLMNNERTLDPIEIGCKINTIAKSMRDNLPDYMMLLCNDRRDYTIFDFTRAKDTDTFEKELRTCFLNRGNILTISEADGNNAWEIWLRDENDENFCYYLFDYTEAVIRC